MTLLPKMTRIRNLICRYIPKTLSARLFALLIAIMSTTALAVIWFTAKSAATEVYHLQSQLADNKIATAMQTIQAEYNDLLTAKIDTVISRRMQMQHVSDGLFSLIKFYRHLMTERMVDPQIVHNLCLSAMESLRYGNNQYFFIADNNLQGISHPMGNMTGTKWSGYKDILNQDALRRVRANLTDENVVYSVFDWPRLSDGQHVRQMGMFRRYAPLGWIIGTTVEISDLIEEDNQRLARLTAKLSALLRQKNRHGASGILLYNGQGRELGDHDLTQFADSCPLKSRMPEVRLNFLEKCIAPRRQIETNGNDPCNRSNFLFHAQYFKPLNWYALLYINKSVIQEPVRNLVTKQALIMVLILFFSVFVAAGMIDKISTPLQQLHMYAKDLHRDNRLIIQKQRRWALTGRQDEIGSLARSFAIMEDRLGRTLAELFDHRQNLSQRVADRTQKLNQSVREKEVLLRELSHRTKNNLQVIMSLITLQRAESNDPRLQQAFMEIKNRILSMAMVHEKLLFSENMAHLKFNHYIEDLATALLSNYQTKGNRITLDLALDPIQASLDAAIPCGLILNECLSNSLKYAFPDNRTGHIRISLKRARRNRLTIDYADTGIGVPDPAAIETGNTLGVRIIRTLVCMQLNGKLEVQANSGLSYRITFADTGSADQAPIAMST